MMILITGGSGSGKSLIAENICAKLNIDTKYYIATMKVFDDECKKRIQKHRAQRDGKGFITIEAPEDFETNIKNINPCSMALLECVGNLTANEQFGMKHDDVVKTVTDEIIDLEKKIEALVIVSNDVFSDISPDEPETYSYVRNIGEVNCILAKKSDIVIESVAGQPILWKGEQKYNEIMA